MSERTTAGPKDRLAQKRRDHEPPAAVAEREWRYHHLGIPCETRRPSEVYIERLKIHVSGFETSPYEIEWMRFEPGCPVSELVRTVPHIAFEVDDLDEALKDREILSPPSSPSDCVRVAMIVHDGAPSSSSSFGSRTGSRLPGGVGGSAGLRGRLPRHPEGPDVVAALLWGAPPQRYFWNTGPFVAVASQ
jgi:hypothetical protein